MAKYNIEELKNELKEAAKIKEYPERHIKIVLVIKKALADFMIEPVLVGGGAVEFYTMGAYTTGDIDLVAPSGKDIVERLKLFGFEKKGKNFVSNKLNIFLEFPSGSLSPDEKYNELDIDGEKIRIISIEDLIVDRLNAFKWWGSTIDGVNSLLLLNSKIVNINKKQLEIKIRAHDLMDAYRGIVEMWKDIQDGKLDMAKASQSIAELGRRLKHGNH